MAPGGTGAIGVIGASEVAAVAVTASAARGIAETVALAANDEETVAVVSTPVAMISGSGAQ
jgi:hypothetical protein